MPIPVENLICQLLCCVARKGPEWRQAQDGEGCPGFSKDPQKAGEGWWHENTVLDPIRKEVWAEKKMEGRH